jgi:phosphatidylglycerol:prolipoprotein diacylglycerol transferase
MAPEIHIGEGLMAPTYFVYLSLLYSFLLYFAYWRAQKKHMYVEMALQVSLLIMVSGFLGARLFHVLYEAPEYYAQNPFDIFKFWLGGFVFYGGMLTSFIVCWIYLHQRKESFGFWADFFAPIMALGYGLGRGACFFAGCCYGKICELPWAVEGRHPTQLYALLYELGVFGFLMLRKSTKYSGDLFAQWIILHSLGRLVLEQFRDDYRGALILGLTISTWVSLGLFSLSTAYFSARQLSKLLKDS